MIGSHSSSVALEEQLGSDLANISKACFMTAAGAPLLIQPEPAMLDYGTLPMGG